MILADSNVFIDFWNNPTDNIIRVFEQEEIVICGVVRAELLHGAVSEKDVQTITTMLEAFDEYNLESSDWQTLGEQLYRLRTKGITVPFQDAVIASIAIKYKIPVWTGDRHFALIQNALNGFEIYSIE